MPRLLLITNGNDIEEFAETCAEQSDFETIRASNPAAAQQAAMEQDVDCVLITGQVPDLDLMAALELIQSTSPDLPVIFYQQEMTVATALQLIRAGAYHCSSGLEGLDSVRDYVLRAIDVRRQQNRKSQRATGAEAWRAQVVGESREMEAVIDIIRQIGPRRSTVLITGETGVGKEVVAKALHGAGPRASQPFVAINCSALPENLLEAELFGHVKGAFTGAMNHRVGRFEQANKGTLFLDEIGDMPLEMQAKLLRVMQEREIQRLGGSENVKVDVRVIAATNLDLLQRVREGKFREDLYYRLNVVPIHISPLRQRVSDIPELVYHFVKKVCQAEGLPLRRLTPEAIDRLKAHPWPGNVRQLENAIEKAIVLSGDRDVLTPVDFGMANVPRPQIVPQETTTDVSDVIPEGMRFDAAVSQFEASMLFNAMAKTGGNKTAAAELLGLKRTTLIMKLRNYENAGAPLMLSRMAG